jgi:PKD repeat protein
MVGASLRGDDSAAVTNGVLTELNFTAVGTGTTTVVLETLTSPAHHYTDTYYSLLMDSNFIEYDNFAPIGCTVLVGVSRAPPIAVFTITSPPVNNVTELVLHQNIPGDVFLKGIPWARAYIGLPELFNASLSYAPTGNITAYIWDFGDGNTTVVNVTSPASALITHVYDNVTHYFVTLTVVASVSGSPSMSSQPAVYAVLVDLALPYYNWDWFIYTVFGLIVAAIVISATRSAFRRVRRRNALKKQKMLTAGPSSRPPTSAKPT